MIEILTSTPLGVLSERQALEDAFILRLAGLTTESGGFLRLLAPFNGDDSSALGGSAEQDFYRTLATKAPAILVTTGASTTRHRSNRGIDDSDEIAVEILAVSTHWRDPIDRVRLRGDLESDPTLDPGVYHMLRAARRLLMGRATGIEGAGHIVHVGETPVVQERGCCAWRAAYRVSVHIAQDLAEVDRDEWDELRLSAVLACADGYRAAYAVPDPADAPA